MKKLLEEMLKENAGIDNAFLIKVKGLILRVPRDAQEIQERELPFTIALELTLTEWPGSRHLLCAWSGINLIHHISQWNIIAVRGPVQGQPQLRNAIISKNFCSCIRETDERTRRKDGKEVRIMAKQSIRSIRKGSVQWNEEDRLQMVSMLAKAGYAVQIVRKEVPGGENRKSAQYEYVIEYGEKVE